MLCLCFSHPEASRAAQFHILRAGKPLPVWLPMPMTSQESSLDSELFEVYDLLLSLHSPSQGLAASRCPFIVEWMSRQWNFSSSSPHLLCFFSITFLSIFHTSGLIQICLHSEASLIVYDYTNTFFLELRNNIVLYSFTYRVIFLCCSLTVLSQPVQYGGDLPKPKLMETEPCYTQVFCQSLCFIVPPEQGLGCELATKAHYESGV